jgi:RNA polymerase sigma factor (TIGR02999 family)
MTLARTSSRPSPEHITDLLVAWSRGEASALAQLTPLVHHELRRLARSHLRGERDNHTLQTDALVSEAYVRLVDLSRVDWRDRTHFFSLSARLMRRILVDYARSRLCHKRGGGMQQISLDDVRGALAANRGTDLVALDDALAALASVDPRKAQVVELRFFGGLSVAEISETLQVSDQTVMRDWRVARLWLLREISGDAQT